MAARTPVVDSVDEERNIRRVFSMTLLGLAQFRSKARWASSTRKRVSQGGGRCVSGHVEGGGVVSEAVSRYSV